jgi:hypothetical protein
MHSRDKRADNQNIERQAHALRARAPGKAADPPAAAPDFGEDDFEGEE